MTKEQKSSCCGADVENQLHIYDDIGSPTGKDLDGNGEWGDTCITCGELCKEIPPDCLSKKEILEFCDKWEGELYLDNDANYCQCLEKSGNLKEQHLGDFFDDLQLVLKSVKEIFKVKNKQEFYIPTGGGDLTKMTGAK